MERQVRFGGFPRSFVASTAYKVEFQMRDFTTFVTYVVGDVKFLWPIKPKSGATYPHCQTVTAAVGLPKDKRGLRHFT